jgi:hypothetical protein
MVVSAIALATLPLGASGAGAVVVSQRETVFSAPGLGRAVSVYAGTVVASGTGAVFVYNHGSGQWALETVLRPSDGVPSDGFGDALAIRGSFVVVGAPNATVDGKPGAGAVYVFVRLPDGVTWFQYPRLTAPTPTAGAHFGAAVDTSAEVEVIAGAPGAGTATVFFRFPLDDSPGVWFPIAQLAAPNLTGAQAIAAGFGASVSLSGAQASVGAPDAAVVVPPGTMLGRAGRVFAFRSSGFAWAFDGELRDSAPRADGHFGRRVAENEGVFLVGIPGSLSLEGFTSGAPGVYTSLGRDLGGPGFGNSVGTDGMGIAGDPSARAAYLYSLNPPVVGTIVPGSGPPADGFGASADVEGTTAVVGAPGAQAIHIFDVAPVATPDHASVSTSGALSYAASGDVTGNFTIARTGGRVVAVTGAGRIGVAATHLPFVGFDLHAFGQSGLLAGEIRIRDYVTGFVHTFRALSLVVPTAGTRVDGIALAFDASMRPPGPVVVRWTIDDLS